MRDLSHILLPFCVIAYLAAWASPTHAQSFCSVDGGLVDRRDILDQTALACVDSAGFCYPHDLQLTRLRVRFWVIRDSALVPGVSSSQLDGAFSTLEFDYMPWGISFERLSNNYIEDDYLMNNIESMSFNDVEAYVNSNFASLLASDALNVLALPL